jgi:hypothetical protein
MVYSCRQLLGERPPLTASRVAACRALACDPHDSQRPASTSPRLNRIQATNTRGIRARIRRVAGCATPTGSAGHAGATANLKLTFHLDQSAGADQSASAKFFTKNLRIAACVHGLHAMRQRPDAPKAPTFLDELGGKGSLKTFKITKRSSASAGLEAAS